MLRYLLFLILVSCGAGSPKSPTSQSQQSEQVTAPKFHTAKIKNTYPHHKEAYTQGLVFSDGVLYESTGEYGHSTLRKVELTTGKVIKNLPLASQFFGEGLELYDGKLYQLTWREGKVFIYDISTFKQVATYDLSGEGWGITSHNGELYITDGTAQIRVVDPSNFRVLRTIDVRSDRGAIDQLNELEWIEGRIWANVYFSPLVVVINPETGIVEQVIDCSALAKQINNPQADVQNGIAYDTLQKRIFMTGKNWEKLFEIEL